MAEPQDHRHPAARHDSGMARLADRQDRDRGARKGRDPPRPAREVQAGADPGAAVGRLCDHPRRPGRRAGAGTQPRPGAQGRPVVGPCVLAPSTQHRRGDHRPGRSVVRPSGAFLADLAAGRPDDPHSPLARHRLRRAARPGRLARRRRRMVLGRPDDAVDRGRGEERGPRPGRIRGTDRRGQARHHQDPRHDGQRRDAGIRNAADEPAAGGTAREIHLARADARRRGRVGAAPGHLGRHPRHHRQLPADRGRCRRHPDHPPARPVPEGPGFDRRRRRARLPFNDRGAAERDPRARAGPDRRGVDPLGHGLAAVRYLVFVQPAGRAVREGRGRGRGQARHDGQDLRRHRPVPRRCARRDGEERGDRERAMAGV